MKKYVISLAMCILILVPQGCGNMSNTGKDAIIGGGAGAALGAAVGAMISKDGKGAAIGAAIGSSLGAGTGAIIGRKMDKKAEELAAQLEQAEVETVEDSNGLEAIKVTFGSGILFPTNGTSLSRASEKQLTDFAYQMQDLPDTDISIFGHTDNTGTAEVNERISNQRADAVSTFLKGRGIAAERITAEGKSFNEPVADNATKEGRAQNRRVEIYIYANEAMVEAANNGTLE